MHPNSTLLYLYRDTLKKYRKFRKRLTRNIEQGTFRQLTLRKQHQILRKIDRLKRRLEQLSLQLKLGIAAGSMVLALNVESAQAQGIGPFKRNEAANPLRSPISTDYRPAPVTVDFDGDGDLDIFLGNQNGDFLYFKNEGTVSNPIFVEQEGAANPFDGMGAPNGASSLVFLDYDNDSDLDMFSGNGDGEVILYEDSAGIIVERGTAAPENPIGNTLAGSNSKLALFDFDGDTDEDVFIGGGDAVYLWENNGDGTFTEINDTINPFFNYNNSYPTLKYETAPAFADYDGDGDTDAFFGNDYGTILYFENDGSGNFSPTFPSPLPDTLDNYTTPTFADLDNDGDPDAIIGSDFGAYGDKFLAYYENDGFGNFTQLIGLNSPVGGVDVGFKASIDFTDVDGDNDLDAFLGEKEGSIIFYRNDPTGFSLDTAGNPLKFVNLASDSHPRLAFVDINGDNLEDAYVGDGVGDDLKYYQNNGAGFDPDAANSLADTLAGSLYGSGDYGPTLADVDSDGDFDAFIGQNYSGPYGNLLFFRNDDASGMGTMPSFVDDQTPANNPFSGVNFGNPFTDDAYPRLEDIDHDGDPDLFVFQRDGTGVFYSNDDPLTSPVTFTPQVGPSNPFDGVDTYSSISVLSFADIDQDGDLDGFIAIGKGTVHYYENQNTAPGITATTSSFFYPPGAGVVTIDPGGITISDSDGNMYGIIATVRISNGYVNGEDLLDMPVQPNITTSFNAGTGVLTLTGFAPLTEYETALGQVTYENTSGTPTVQFRTVDFSAIDNDATNSSNIASVTIDVGGVPNSPPVVTQSSTDLTYTEGDGAVPADNGVVVTDSDNSDLQSATVSIIGNFTASEDVLVFTDQNGITGSYNASTGVLSLSGQASVANYQAALRAVTYENTSENFDPAMVRSIEFVVDDGTDPSTAAVRDIQLVPINDPPSVTVTVTTFSYLIGQGPVVIDPNITVTDVDDTDIESATIGIVNNFVAGEDVLGFINQDSITGSFDGMTGVLSLTGIAPIADYETALRSVTYENLSLEPNTVQRTVAFVVNDGIDSSPPAAAQNEIQVEFISEVIVFNAVSPNGDDKHDFLEIQAISLFPSNRVDIFNRWGNTIFEMDGYDNNDVTRRFNGFANVNGNNELPDGTYFYKINLGDGSPILSGFLVLKK